MAETQEKGANQEALAVESGQGLHLVEDEKKDEQKHELTDEMEKASVPMNQYPQAGVTPDHTGATQPPTYNDPTAQHQYQQAQMYNQPQHPQQAYAQTPPPQGYQSPPPQHPQGAYDAKQQQQQQYGQPQPHPAMAPHQQSGMVYQNVTPIASLNRAPAPVDCPACGQRALTTVNYETGNTTHAWALGLCCFFCLGCIPYLMNSLKDVQHKCGKCGVLLATWHRSGSTEVHLHS